MLYCSLKNINKELPMVVLPREECLTDIQFEKGWRILEESLTVETLCKVLGSSWHTYTSPSLVVYKDASKFYQDYLMEDILDDIDGQYLQSIEDPFYEDSYKESEEEEINVEFFEPTEESIPCYTC